MHEQDYIQHIDDMIKEYNDMSLYVFNIEPEATQDVMKSITHAMNIKFDFQKLKKSLDSNQIVGAEKICVFFKEEDTRQFVLLSCHQKCYAYEIIVRCLQEDSKTVINSFEPWRTDFFENIGGSVMDSKDLYHDDIRYSYREGKKVLIEPVKSTFRFNGLIDE